MAGRASSRSRRFELPDLKDERADEVIEAYLGGAVASKARSRTTGGVKPGNEIALQAEPVDAVALRAKPGDAVALRTMPGRLAWNDALDRESTRSIRYGRPSAVAILELRPLRPSATIDSWVRMHATPVGQALLRLSRATDIVARVAATRFHVLLPETSSDGAGEFVERVVGECEEQLRALGAPLRVHSSVAASSAEVALHDALADAVRSIEAAPS